MTPEQIMDEDILRLLRGITRRRLTRVLMYGLMAVGAVISAVAPSEVLVQQSNPALATVWAFSFGIAAATCLIGSIMDRWIAEYTMIPLLSATLIVFSLAMVGQSQGDVGWRIIPYALLFSAFALGLVARWRDVQSLLRAGAHLEGK